MFYGASLMDMYRRAATLRGPCPEPLGGCQSFGKSDGLHCRLVFPQVRTSPGRLLTEPQVSEDEQYDDDDPDDVEDVHDLPASCVISSRFSADRPPFP
jgi:hypothetical protein